MEKNWRVGNASVDGADRRGWLIGHFIEEDPLRSTKDVEIKWAHHPAGDERAEWVTDEYRTTVIFLISGRFRIELPGASEVLADEGDYAMWGAGVDHSWRAEQDSTVVTIRWPSLA